MTLTTRQKILIPVLILVILFLVWEVLQMKQQFTSVEISPANLNKAQDDTVPAPKPVAFIEPSHIVNLSPEQKDYLKLISQYKNLQLAKMIAQNNQAIAQAHLKTAEANVQLEKITDNKSIDASSNFSLTAIQEAYKLVYTGKLAGHWTATLKKGNELIDINIGSHLENGFVVKSITGSNVVLSKGDTLENISFIGTTIKKVSAKPVVVAHKTESNNKVLNLKKDSIAKVEPIQSIAISKKVGVKKKSLKKPHEQISLVSAIPKFIEMHTLAIKKSKVVHHADAINSTEKKILSLKPQDYTIQLIGSYFPDAITNYISMNNLIGRSLSFHTYYRGKPWYAVIFGHYKTIVSAEQVLKSLPQKMKLNRPFVRKLWVIQKEIKTHQVV